MEINSNDLQRLYVEERLTIKEIAAMYDVSYSKMRRSLLKNGINLRGKGEMDGRVYKHVAHNKIVLSEEQVDKCKVLYENNVPVNDISDELGISKKAIIRYVKECGWKRTKSMMSREQYDNTNDKIIISMYNNGKSTTDIAKDLNVTHRTVINHLKHNGIDRRSISEAQFSYNKKEIPEVLQDYEKLYNLYVEERLSKKEISKKLGVSPNVINRKLKEYGIRIRGCSEAFKGRHAGSKHPNWKGGVTSLYRRIREFIFKPQVRSVLKRDGYKCQLCGSTKNLQVHHIRHFSEIFYEILSEHPELDINRDMEELVSIFSNDQRMLDEDNLITYCRDCHLFEIHGYQRTDRSGW